MTTMINACNACGRAALHHLGAVGRKPASVTSDSRPAPLAANVLVCERCGHVQKHPTPTEQAAIDRIYAEYAAHHLSDGREQLIFPPGLPPRPRTVHVLEQCRALLPARGRLLDVGTGMGAVLRTAHQLLGDGWELYGHDVSDHKRAIVEALPGVRTFWAGGVEQIPDASFDVIVLWHVLEHIPEPVTALAGLRSKLTDNGYLLVQVPALERNAFDLAVIDHSSHFTASRLEAVAKAAGLRVAVDGADWVHNCHTLLLQPGEQAAIDGAPDPAGRAAVTWLQRALEQMSVRVGDQDFAVFGTGMAGLWLITQFDRPPRFLVDEDTARAGKQVEGVPVIAPADLPDAMPVVMAFLPATGQSIASRLRQTYRGWANRPILQFDGNSRTP